MESLFSVCKRNIAESVENKETHKGKNKHSDTTLQTNLRLLFG